MATASGNSSPNPNPQQIDTTAAAESVASRYYCHSCNREVENVGEDFTCPQCHLGFLEIILDSTPDVRGRSSSGGSVHSHDESTSPVDFDEFFRNVAGPMLSNLLQMQTGRQQQQQSSTGQPSLSRPSSFSQQQNANIPIPPANSGGSNPNLASGSSTGQPGQAQAQMPFQGFLQQLFEGLTNNGVFQVQFQLDNDEGGRHGFSIPMNLHGNPGDYAWGPGGLDAIVTQLLNQVEGGSPPMASDHIEKLPDVTVTKEQTEKRSQCAVCMEEFKVAEKVKQLTCEHLFHYDCIKPWLERHNSCPVCRKSADSSGNQSGGQSRQQQPPSQSSSNRPRWQDIEDLD